MDRRSTERRLDTLSQTPSAIVHIIRDLRYSRTWKAKLNLKKLEDDQRPA